jgi:hypothetical protein
MYFAKNCYIGSFLGLAELEPLGALPDSPRVQRSIAAFRLASYTPSTVRPDPHLG